jgi:hypothetical protein
MRGLQTIGALAAALALTGCAAQSLSDVGDWYEARGGRPPEAGRVFVCHAFSCTRTTPVAFSQAEMGAITAPLAAAPPDAAAERQAISRSLQAFETIVGDRLGTKANRPGLDLSGAGDPTQMDCLDDATNTTSLLLLLAEGGHLRHHRVLHPVARGFFLDGRYPHATAVVAERETGARWAIDPWPNPNAASPDIKRLEDWLAARPAGLGA